MESKKHGTIIQCEGLWGATVTVQTGMVGEIKIEHINRGQHL